MADRKKNEVSGRWITAYMNSQDVTTSLPSGEKKEVYDTRNTEAVFNFSNLRTESAPAFVFSG